MPPCLAVTAVSDDGVFMAIQHKTLPIAAVQFHPESILMSPSHAMIILKNVLMNLKYIINKFKIIFEKRYDCIWQQCAVLLGCATKKGGILLRG